MCQTGGIDAVYRFPPQAVSVHICHIKLEGEDTEERGIVLHLGNLLCIDAHGKISLTQCSANLGLFLSINSLYVMGLP